MKQKPYELVPLTADEKDLLLLIFHKRRKLLVYVYAVLMGMAFMCAPKGIDRRGRDGKVQHWEEREDAKYLSRMGMVLLNFSWLGAIILSSGVYFYYKSVRPFKKDALSGVKEKVPYLIVRREYFPYTNQYYVGLNDPNYLHHEIDEDTYYKVREGEHMYLFRAACSKFVFERNGRFTIF